MGVRAHAGQGGCPLGGLAPRGVGREGHPHGEGWWQRWENGHIHTDKIKNYVKDNRSQILFRETILFDEWMYIYMYDEE